MLLFPDALGERNPSPGVPKWSPVPVALGLCLNPREVPPCCKLIRSSRTFHSMYSVPGTINLQFNVIEWFFFFGFWSSLQRKSRMRNPCDWFWVHMALADGFFLISDNKPISFSLTNLVFHLVLIIFIEFLFFPIEKTVMSCISLLFLLFYFTLLLPVFARVSNLCVLFAWVTAQVWCDGIETQLITVSLHLCHLTATFKTHSRF